MLDIGKPMDLRSILNTKMLGEHEKSGTFFITSE